MEHPSAQLIIAFIEAGMTSVMQVCDVCINKPLKQYIRNAYGEYRDQRLAGEIGPKLQPGEKFKVPREIVWGFVEHAFQQVNQSNDTSRWIADGFRKCGQDPFWLDRSAFKNHLDSLSENSIYAKMEAAAKTMNLQ
uniref:Uncharacterized protein n=1 Tax=Spongospora subterranea TaxID=70186 RepID=A0A0H5QV64_9EUKA|eukprot:CRZ05647.1 hypothetical protein [Spongospora subterranea]